MKRTKLRQSILNLAMAFSEKGQDTFTVDDLHDHTGTDSTRLWNEVFAMHRSGLLATLGGPATREVKYKQTTNGLGTLMKWRGEQAAASRPKTKTG